MIFILSKYYYLKALSCISFGIYYYLQEEGCDNERFHRKITSGARDNAVYLDRGEGSGIDVSSIGSDGDYNEDGDKEEGNSSEDIIAYEIRRLRDSDSNRDRDRDDDSDIGDEIGADFQSRSSGGQTIMDIMIEESHFPQHTAGGAGISGKGMFAANAVT
jgi:hypothetical protein